MRMIRLSISSGGIPLNCQTTDTTGTSASGKMSVAIRVVLTAPNTAIRTAMTMTVYVRRTREANDPHLPSSFRADGERSRSVLGAGRPCPSPGR